MKGTNRPSNPDRKRAAGYSQTDRAPEKGLDNPQSIEALQKKIADYYDRTDLSKKDQKRAKEFKEKGEKWTMRDPNAKRKKNVSDNTYINLTCMLVETISDKDLEHYKGRPSRKKVKKKKAKLPAGLEAAAALGKGLSIRKKKG
jgi:hypothetical protein